jgi:hypothetical protein
MIPKPPTSRHGYWLAPKIRERHTYLIGKTRTGRTNLLKTLLLQDMRRGTGIAFLDPHGDAAYELLGNIPKKRIQDTIYFDPTSAHAPSFNLFRLPYPPYKLTEDIISLFKMFFGDSWGYRMEHILRMSTLTLLTDHTPHTLKDLQTLLLNPAYRNHTTTSHPNPDIRAFWEREFPSIEKSATNPILNKLSAFLLPSSPMARIFSQISNDLNFPEILNQQKIFIANLAKGKLGDEPSRLLGGLITAGIQQAALSRADLPPQERKDFHFFVDEFHNYIISSFEVILTESAKYRCFLTLAHQNLGQIPTSLERAIFGNIATLISFQISAQDARTLQPEMRQTRTDTRTTQRRKDADEWHTFTSSSTTPYPDIDDFTNLPKYHAFCRVGRAANLFKFRTIPAPPPNPETRNQILTLTKERARERPPEEEPPTTEETFTQASPAPPEPKPKRTPKKKSPPPPNEEETFEVR